MGELRKSRPDSLTVRATRQWTSIDANSQLLANNLALRNIIAEEVKVATDPLRDRIAALEAREESTKTIVRRVFQRLSAHRHLSRRAGEDRSALRT